MGGCHVFDCGTAPEGLVPIIDPPVPPDQPVEPELPGAVPSAVAGCGSVAAVEMLLLDPGRAWSTLPAAGSSDWLDAGLPSGGVRAT